jgi:glycoside hydrolase-like protein
MPRLNHPARVIRTVTAVTAAVAAVAAVLLVASPALADPATTVSYPARASATMYTGLAFETCAAPSLAAMQAWSASPYRGVGVYIGGVNRTCAQPELTVAWVSAVSQLSWRLLPVYKGLQPQCGGKATDQKISLTPATAASQGTAAANDAAARVRALGMVEGSAIYNDIENYNSANTACRASVLTYLSAWTRRLHQLGYVSGVYANLASGAPDLSSVYFSASYARPDALWLARYDLNPSLTPTR